MTKTYTISPLKTYCTVTVRTFHADGKMGVGEEQVFSTLQEALQFVETEETPSNPAKN
jgi:hypothetical protein